MTKTQAKNEEIMRLGREAYEISKEEFPPGTMVWWMHNGHRQEGVVTRWAYARAFVENFKTGKKSRKDTVELNLL